MNPETVAGLTYGLVRMRIEAGESPVTVIGRDTRPSGEWLEPAAVAGALAAGAEVLRLGIAPTPTTLKVAEMVGAGAAVCLTASHNEWIDNGWKGTRGPDKPFGKQVRDISDRYWWEMDNGLAVPFGSKKTVDERPELVAMYQQELVGHLEAEFGEKPLAGKIVVVDGANGAAWHTTPDILRNLGATVEEFSCNPWRYINDGCGATELQGVKDFMAARPGLISNPSFIGAVANDGDADRCIAVGADLRNDTPEFIELEGNRIMALQAEGEPGTVGTDYTNDGMIERLPGNFVFCENGDVNVTLKLREMRRSGALWSRGGEFSGHNVDLRWLSSGDGVRMAAWLACYAATKETTFDEIARTIPLWPQTMIKIKDLPGDTAVSIVSDPEISQLIQDAPGNLQQSGRVLVRPSGTEKGVVRAWGVGRDKELLRGVVSNIAAKIQERAVLK
jgi:phosphoglucosamine mutase